MMFDSANKLALRDTVMYPINDSFKIIGAAGVGFAMYYIANNTAKINTSSKAAQADANDSRIGDKIQVGIKTTQAKRLVYT